MKASKHVTQQAKDNHEDNKLEQIILHQGPESKHTSNFHTPPEPRKTVLRGKSKKGYKKEQEGSRRRQSTGKDNTMDTKEELKVIEQISMSQRGGEYLGGD